MTLPVAGAHIFHVCTRAQADAALALGEYRVPSLESEGFIHLSQAHQVQGVADRYYAGQSGLVLLVVAPDRLHAPLRWEPPGSLRVAAGAKRPDAAQLFPHLYGPLNTDAVLEVLDLALFLALRAGAGTQGPGPDPVG